MKLAIKTKIILWYALIFIVVIIINIGLVTLLSYNSIQLNAEDTLMHEATETAAEIKMEDDGPYVMDDDDERSFDYASDGAVFVIYQNNQVAFGHLPANFDQLPQILLYHIQEVESTASVHYLIYDVVIDDQYVLRTFYSLNDLTIAYNQTVITMLIVAPILIAVSIIGGSIIIRRSFKPINQIYQTAEQIKDYGKYNLRIDIPNTNDEIYKLSLMINEMLDQISGTIDREKEFSSNVSHELRTPLAVLRAQVEFLESKNKNQALKQDIDDILKQLLFMQDMIEELLEFSRAKNIEIKEFESVEINDLLDSMIKSMESLIIDKNITIDFKPYEKDLFLNTQQSLLIRILYNLLTNAIKYNKENGHILVQSNLINKKVIMTIKDSGIGMSKHTLNHIFDPFYRADQSRSVEKGLGIGMSITKSLVELLGGTIEIDSELHIGTTITLTF